MPGEDADMPPTHACKGCGADAPVYVDYCDECELGRALGSMKPPEGGWPRGSDMDRL